MSLKPYKLILAWITCAALSAFAGTLTGTITNLTGATLAGASVSLLKNGASTLSDATGKYTLAATAVRLSASSIHTGAIELVAGAIRLNLQEPVHVRLVLFDLLGRGQTPICDEVLGAGGHIFSLSANNLASKLFFLESTIGKSARIDKFVNIDKDKNNVGETARSRALAKSSAVTIDTLMVSLTGYTTAKKPITTYNGTYNCSLSVPPPVVGQKYVLAHFISTGMVYTQGENTIIPPYLV